MTPVVVPLRSDLSLSAIRTELRRRDRRSANERAARRWNRRVMVRRAGRRLRRDIAAATRAAGWMLLASVALMNGALLMMYVGG